MAFAFVPFVNAAEVGPSPLAALLVVALVATGLSVWAHYIKRRLPPGSADPGREIVRPMLRAGGFIWATIGLLMVVGGLLAQNAGALIVGLLLIALRRRRAPAGDRAACRLPGA